jgi:hypothetical protein
MFVRLFCLLAIGFLVLPSWRAEARENVLFSCGSPPPHICYFKVLYGPNGQQGQTNFTVTNPNVVTIPNIEVGSDTFCVCVDNVPPASGCYLGPDRWCKGRYMPVARQPARNN